MDVMLSIRQQGIVTAPASARQSTSSPQPPVPEGNYASSISSQSMKSQGTGPKTPSSNSVSGFKNLFSSRPRATSRATSFDIERENESYPSMNHMMSKLRPGTADSKRSAERPFLPPLSGFASSFYPLQRKIVRGDNAADSSSDRTDEGFALTTRCRTNRGSATGTSLQPPPRKRRASGAVASPTSGTIVSPTSTISPSSTEAAVEQAPRFSDEPPQPSSPRFSRFGSPQQRPRVPSVQSVSTIGSTDNGTSQDRSSVSTSRSAKRWSRQSVLPTRSIFSGGPQSGSPLSAHLQSHPFAADQNIDRTSSTQSIDKNSLRGFTPSNPRRASTASAFSIKSAGTSHSLVPPQGRTSRPSSAHRTSMPPPAKPAPTSALPPAPGGSSTSSPTRASFRESVAVRVGRLSGTVSPSPTASPDEKPAKSHRRASIGSYFLQPPHYHHSTSSLKDVPSYSDLHAPRPIRPLPPTPTTPQMPDSPPPPPPPAQRESLFKRRLRILSAPATTSNSDDSLSSNIPSNTFQSRLNTIASSIVQTSKPAMPTLISQPSTPIAEKIISSQNDPSFWQFDTPSLPSPRPLPPTPDQWPGMTSLLPPPRRSSKHITVAEFPDSEAPTIPAPTPKPPAAENEHRLISLSRPGSVVSLGIVSV